MPLDHWKIDDLKSMVEEKRTQDPEFARKLVEILEELNEYLKAIEKKIGPIELI